MRLVQAGQVKISEHGYDELAADGIPARDIMMVVDEEEMNKKQKTKLVHEGRYVAEVDVEVMEDETGWSPYLSLEDAYKLDDVRNALRCGDIKGAAKLARVFALTPVAM